MRKLVFSYLIPAMTAVMIISCDRTNEPEPEPVLPPEAPVITDLSETLDDEQLSSTIRFEVKIGVADSAFTFVTAPDGEEIYRNSVTIGSTTIIDLKDLDPGTVYTVNASAVNMSVEDGLLTSSATLEISTAAEPEPEPDRARVPYSNRRDRELLCFQGILQIRDWILVHKRRICCPGLYSPRMEHRQPGKP